MELLIEKVSSGESRACLPADMDLTRREFGYADASAVERVLIDAIVAARLRLALVDLAYADKGFNQALSAYWENPLNSAQFRLLRAGESQARMQRLARYSPTLQINLAANSRGEIPNPMFSDRLASALLESFSYLGNGGNGVLSGFCKQWLLQLFFRDFNNIPFQYVESAPR